MRIAFSNLAWDPAEDESVAVLMQRLGAGGVELAVTKVWEQPVAVEDNVLTDYRDWWRRRAIQIVSLQALLFGPPELVLFGSAKARGETLAYLTQMIRIAEKLGADRLVFGSPRNRAKGMLSEGQANEIAIPFFRELGDRALEHGVVFCLEPNPIQYGCDWITRVEEGVKLVNDIASLGIGLNIDTGGMVLAGDDAQVSIDRSKDVIRHFHVSEPGLAPVGKQSIDHHALAAALRRTGYAGWCSVEMQAPEPGDRLTELERSLRFAIEAYG